jgi:2-keto-3-deoxy-L-rhamnonate aldolase RhmA
MKKLCLAAWQQLPGIQITAAMASLGFDWIVVDLEHTSITIQEAEAIFIAAERHGSKPFARLPSADPYLARRLLDAGAVGLFIPVVESREAFDSFALHCFFPPYGKRGLGLTRSNLWGANLTQYMDESQPTLIAQIETKTGADNIESILSSEFLNGIMIGPYDLSASLNQPAKFNTPLFKSLCQSILSSAKKNNKTVGFHQVSPDINMLRQKITEGYDFIAYGTDVVALRHALEGIQKL